jgi:hypothetical protein
MHVVYDQSRGDLQVGTPGKIATAESDLDSLGRMHPGLQRRLSAAAAGSSPLASPRAPSPPQPGRVVCRICEEPVAARALAHHSRACAMLEATCQHADVDVALTRLAQKGEEWAGDPQLSSANAEDGEDMVAACRQAASLQPDGTSHPFQRCTVS